MQEKGVKSDVTIKTPKVCQRCRSGVFIVNCKRIPYLLMVFLLLTLSK